ACLPASVCLSIITRLWKKSIIVPPPIHPFSRPLLIVSPLPLVLAPPKLLSSSAILFHLLPSQFLTPRSSVCRPNVLRRSPNSPTPLPFPLAPRPRCLPIARRCVHRYLPRGVSSTFRDLLASLAALERVSRRIETLDRARRETVSAFFAAAPRTQNHHRDGRQIPQGCFQPGKRSTHGYGNREYGVSTAEEIV
ncbi:hypothetical protein EX30DRAFT_333136, partial [Ascodesmis nigricans]